MHFMPDSLWKKKNQTNKPKSRPSVPETEMMKNYQRIGFKILFGIGQTMALDCQMKDYLTLCPKEKKSRKFNLFKWSFLFSYLGLQLLP